MFFSEVFFCQHSRSPCYVFFLYDRNPKSGNQLLPAWMSKFTKSEILMTQGQKIVHVTKRFASEFGRFDKSKPKFARWKCGRFDKFGRSHKSEPKGVPLLTPGWLCLASMDLCHLFLLWDVDQQDGKPTQRCIHTKIGLAFFVA